VPPRGWILGRGRSTAPGSGQTEPFDGKLRQATLRTISDKECAKDFKHERGNGGERFDAKRMVCAIDVDGKSSLSSGCNGDSGGPLYTGSDAAPALIGVVSFGGSRCGADLLPSVFAEVRPTGRSSPTRTRCGRPCRCRPPRSPARRRSPRGGRRPPGPVRDRRQQRRRHLERALRQPLEGQDPSLMPRETVIGTAQSVPDLSADEAVGILRSLMANVPGAIYRVSLDGGLWLRLTRPS
jgi:hypothetical protein